MTNIFDIDNQTFDDLEIFKVSSKSLFSLFDKTSSTEGSATLKLIFKNPLTDHSLIFQRKSLIEKLQISCIAFELDRESMEFIEFYLAQNNLPKIPSSFFRFKQVIYDYFRPTRELYIRERGVKEVLDLLVYLDNLLLNFVPFEDFHFFKKLNEILTSLKINKQINSCFTEKEIKLNSLNILDFDYEIRKNEKNKINYLLTLIYELDAYFAVAKTAKQHGLTYPTINNEAEKFIKISGLRHMFIERAISNDIYLSPEKNVSFITGVNMAGKSTFLKSIGIAVYLSHLGFPVPADNMITSVFDGLVTTINVSDSLSEGSSHFYSEVKRVKEVAEKTSKSKNIIVIFDEFFRGTNVKDAYEASVSIIDAFSKIKTCLLLVSTHIIEVAQDLKDNQNIDFKFLETKMVNGSPVFSHQLKPGISTDRMGLWIIENEGILKILNDNANR